MATSWQGRERFAARMARLPAIAKKHITDALEQSAAEIVAMQKRVVPVGKTGHLKASIKYAIGGGRVKHAIGGGGANGEFKIRITAGNAKVRYAHLVEFGTAPHMNKGRFAGTMNPGMPPQPFFFGPYRANKKRVKSRIRRAFKKAVAASKGA